MTPRSETNEPDTNETEARIASAIAIARPIRARSDRRASLGTTDIDQRPICFMRSTILSTVGSDMSCTILPSARNTTRSA